MNKILPALTVLAAADFVAAHHTMWTTVRFLGVWDTVAALRVPFRRLDIVVDRIPFSRQRHKQ